MGGVFTGSSKTRSASRPPVAHAGTRRAATPAGSRLAPPPAPPESSAPRRRYGVPAQLRQRGVYRPEDAPAARGHHVAAGGVVGGADLRLLRQRCEVLITPTKRSRNSACRRISGPMSPSTPISRSTSPSRRGRSLSQAWAQSAVARGACSAAAAISAGPKASTNRR